MTVPVQRFITIQPGTSMDLVVGPYSVTFKKVDPPGHTFVRWCCGAYHEMTVLASCGLTFSPPSSLAGTWTFRLEAWSTRSTLCMVLIRPL